MGVHPVQVFRRNILLMLISHFANYVVPLVTFPYLASVLGVEAFGIISLGSAISTYGVLIIDWGFGVHATKLAATAASDSELSDVFWAVALAKVLLAPLYIVVCFIYLSIYGNVEVTKIVLIMSGSSLAMIFNVAWLLQGRQTIVTLTGLTTLFRLMTVPLILWTVKAPGDSWKAAIALTLPAVGIASASCVIGIRRGFIFRPQLHLARAIFVLRESFSLFIANAAANLYTTANLVVISMSYGVAEAGIYSAADRFRSATQGLVIPIGQAVFPEACRRMGEDEQAGFRLARKVMWAQTAFLALVSLTLVVFSRQIIVLLIGAQYARAIPILRCLAVCPVLVSLSHALGMLVIIPKGMKEYFSKVRVSAGILGIIVSLAVASYLPFFFIALSTVSAELLIFLMLVVKAKKIGFQFF